MVCDEPSWDFWEITAKITTLLKRRKKIKKKSESQFLDLKNYITKYCFSACFIYYAHCIRSLFIAFCKKRTSRNFNLRDDTDPIIISRLIKRERKCESHSHDALSIHPACDVDDRREGCTPSPRFIPTDTFAGEFSRYPTKSKIPHTRGWNPPTSERPCGQPPCDSEIQCRVFDSLDQLSCPIVRDSYPNPDLPPLELRVLRVSLKI